MICLWMDFHKFNQGHLRSFYNGGIVIRVWPSKAPARAWNVSKYSRRTCRLAALSVVLKQWLTLALPAVVALHGAETLIQQSQGAVFYSSVYSRIIKHSVVVPVNTFSFFKSPLFAIITISCIYCPCVTLNYKIQICKLRYWGSKSSHPSSKTAIQVSSLLLLKIVSTKLLKYRMSQSYHNFWLIAWWLILGVPCLSPNVSWDWL